MPLSCNQIVPPPRVRAAFQGDQCAPIVIDLIEPSQPLHRAGVRLRFRHFTQIKAGSAGLRQREIGYAPSFFEFECRRPENAPAKTSCW